MASVSYAPESSRFVVRDAPRSSSSSWMSPIPPPISRTEAPARSCDSAKSTMRRAAGVRPSTAIVARQPPGEALVELLLVFVRGRRDAALIHEVQYRAPGLPGAVTPGEPPT